MKKDYETMWEELVNELSKIMNKPEIDSRYN
jgi:hypothetical protein